MVVPCFGSRCGLCEFQLGQRLSAIRFARLRPVVALCPSVYVFSICLPVCGVPVLYNGSADERRFFRGVLVVFSGGHRCLLFGVAACCGVFAGLPSNVCIFDALCPSICGFSFQEVSSRLRGIWIVRRDRRRVSVPKGIAGHRSLRAPVRCSSISTVPQPGLMSVLVARAVRCVVSKDLQIWFQDVFFPSAGYREHGSGAHSAVGSSCYYWCGDAAGTAARYLVAVGSAAMLGDASYRTECRSLRCVQEVTWIGFLPVCGVPGSFVGSAVERRFQRVFFVLVSFGFGCLASALCRRQRQHRSCERSYLRFRRALCPRSYMDRFSFRLRGAVYSMRERRRMSVPRLLAGLQLLRLRLRRIWPFTVRACISLRPVIVRMAFRCVVSKYLCRENEGSFFDPFSRTILISGVPAGYGRRKCDGKFSSPLVSLRDFQLRRSAWFGFLTMPLFSVAAIRASRLRGTCTIRRDRCPLSVRRGNSGVRFLPGLMPVTWGFVSRMCS